MRRTTGTLLSRKVIPLAAVTMDWFERLTGFRETSYEETRRRLEVHGRQLRSPVNGRSYGIGQFELLSLRELRERVRLSNVPSGRLRLGVVQGDVRRLHQAAEYAGALFQVASQFNMLEMVSPNVIPEHGVTRYRDDPTQGPACAIAAGAATIFRNYFVAVGAGFGQTTERQIDALADIGTALSTALGRPVEDLWSMRNGYALCSGDGLDAITAHLASLTPLQIDALMSRLHIGLHSDVEVTDSDATHRPHVSQAFCSALPVAYSRVPPPHWRSFASLVLDAAYEATLCAAVLNARRGSSNIVLLTRIGGGAFGNDSAWIDAAIKRALEKMAVFALDVRVVTYGSPPAALLP